MCLNDANGIMQAAHVPLVLAENQKTTSKGYEKSVWDGSTTFPLEEDMGKDFEPESWRHRLDIVIAVEEGCSRMTFERHAIKLDFAEDDIVTCMSLNELMRHMAKAQRTNLSRPLVVIVGEESWLSALSRLVHNGRRPYVIDATCTGREHHCHSVLHASCDHLNLEDALEDCLDWWADATTAAA
mmetsp:Transcript_21255/g.40004  ORF Transcript_21255/g.40004 Transcript_21255/m.40004 type:complete len:184 (+) Transcript_21255:53-604(+)